MISDDEKRWLVIGLVLNKVLLPQIRGKVEQDVKTEYFNLVKSHKIDTQSSIGRLTRWKVTLEYKNINGNDVHKLRNGKTDYKKFNYQITSHHDFAKLYLQSFMAKFSKFDECDASAVLTLLGAVPVFSAATQAAAANVRQNVRNEWAHCDFARWKEPVFKNCFREIDTLVQSLGLSNCSQIMTELRDWETEGLKRLTACPVDQTLLTMAQQDIASLKTEAQMLKPTENAKTVAKLANLSDRLTAIEKKVNENERKIAANSNEIAENARDVAVNKVKVAAISDEIEAIKGKMAVDDDHLAASVFKGAECETVDRFLPMKKKLSLSTRNFPPFQQWYTKITALLQLFQKRTFLRWLPTSLVIRWKYDDLTARICNSATRLFSIWGSGGFGKTSLVVAVGHRLRERGIRTWFVSLRSVGTAEALTEKLLTFLGQTPHSTVKSQSQALDSLCRSIRTIASDTVLILDNIDDLLLPSGETKSNFLHSIKELVQASTKLKIVCTSRESMSYANLTLDVYERRIRVLKAAESVSLLDVLTGDLICKEQDSLEYLSKVCGYAPLGLKLLATMMSQDKVLPRDIISDLDTSNILQIIDNEDCPDDLRLQKILEFSFSKLSENYQKTFVSLTVFPGSFDARAAAAVLDTRKVTEVRKSLGVLVRKTLLDVEQNGRYSMHTLLQAFGKLVEEKNSKMKECQVESRIRHHRYFIQLLERLNESFLSGHSSDALNRFNKDKASFMFCILDAPSYEQTYAKATNLITNMDIFLYTILWDDNTLSNKLYDKYISSCKENCDRNSVLYAKVLLSKAFGFLHRRSTLSDQLLSEAYDVLQKLPSVPSAVEAKFFCYRGFNKLILSQVEKGAAFLEKGVVLFGTATENAVIHSIALRLLLDIYQKRASHITTARVTQKAQSLCQDYKYLEAILFAQHAGKGNRDTTENKPFLGQVFYFLSRVCKSTHSTAHIKDSLLLEVKSTDEICAKVGDSLEMAKQYHVSGDSLTSVDCTSEALEAYEKALDIRLKLLGKNNEETATSYRKIGTTLDRLGEYDRALHFHGLALDIRLKVLGKDNKDTASSYSNIGYTHYKLGDYNSALEFHKLALDIRMKVLGKDHEDTAWSHYNIGGVYSKMEDYSSALESHKHALDTRLKLHGKKHKDTAWSYNNLGETQSKLGDHDKALDSYKEALDIRLKVCGSENEDTAWSYSNLGVTQSKLGDHSSALDSHKQAYEIRLKLFGRDDKYTKWSYKHIRKESDRLRGLT